jgi:hypothetical protein
MNEYQETRFVGNMVHAMFNSLSGKRISLFGAASPRGHFVLLLWNKDFLKHSENAYILSSLWYC